MKEKHEVENLMRSTMENLRDMIDVNTIIGDTIETSDGSSIIPISKVAFGFASGGSEFGKVNETPEKGDLKYPFGGGSGAGVTVKPEAFLIVKDDSVKLIPMDYNSTVDRAVDSIPQVLDMVKDFLENLKKKKNSKVDINETNVNINIEHEEDLDLD